MVFANYYEQRQDTSTEARNRTIRSGISV